MSLTLASTMCADFCTDEYDDAIEYGFDVVSIVEQRSVTGLKDGRIETLPSTLSRGKALCITASTYENCQRWAVNLLCGSEHTSEIAFHFNPRILQHYIARNSRHKGQWGQEESLALGRFVIKPGEDFELKIFTADDQFFVSYNGKHVCSFQFRVPLSSITHVEINGKLDVEKIYMESFAKYPDSESDLRIIREPDQSTSNNTFTMESPVRAYLPEGLKEEWQVEIYGRPKILPQTFTVDLQNEVHIWPPSTIALHMNASFGNNMLVRNAFVDNKWGMQERIGGFKFLPVTPFSIWVRRSMKRYSIWVNEKLQAEFAFRCDPDVVRAVLVQGDVDISGIYINKDPEKYF